jgi:protein TonB
VVKNMPSWKPGKQRGKSVTVQYNLPIRFTLR